MTLPGTTTSLPSWTIPHSPTPPSWTLDWFALQDRFPWLARLAGCPQDPIYHAEGDVLMHTRMVCAAMATLEAWRMLPESERALLFAAALLHDIGKPACTVMEADGRISSRGHSRVGAAMARRLLYRDWADDQSAPLPATREAIGSLVRYHSLPLYFLDAVNPQRAVIRASQLVALAPLALLAEADVLGRHCDTQTELLDRITLFREYCQELGCLHAPRRFANPASRFRYLRTEHADPDYVAYDDSRCEVVLLAGLPGAGKDTWLRRNLAGWPVVSLDALRESLEIEPTEKQGPVIEAAFTQARRHLRAGQSFVWNATNVRRATRRRVIALFLDYGTRVRIVYLEAPLPVILRRNAARAADAVPEAVIRRMAGDLEVPDVTEAHQVEWVHTGA